jgi:hypothetical protein
MGKKQLSPEERNRLRCPTHGILMVDGRSPEGKPEPSRYCALCTKLRIVDVVRDLYEPEEAERPACAWIPDDF